MVIISTVRVGVSPVGMEISAQRRYAPTDIMGKTVKIAVLANLMVQEGMYNLRVCMLLSRDTITIFWNSLISITIIFYLFRKSSKWNNFLCSCDRITGQCSCYPGRTGENCEKSCPSMTFGEECNSTCTCKAGFHNGCDHTTGKCNCLRGWTGKFSSIYPILMIADETLRLH